MRKIAIFVGCALLSGISLSTSAEEASPSLPGIGWTLITDTTLPSLDAKMAEQGMPSPHICTYKALDSKEGATQMVLLIPGACIQTFWVAGFTGQK